MFKSLPFFRSEKIEKVSFQTLSEAQKQIAESAHKIYFDASLEEQTQPTLDPETGQSRYVGLEELIKNGEEATADGWATFTAYIAKKNKPDAPDMERTKKAFEKAYSIGSENKDAASANITFDKFSDVQKNAWLASAQFIHNKELDSEATSTPTCPAH